MQQISEFFYCTCALPWVISVRMFWGKTEQLEILSGETRATFFILLSTTTKHSLPPIKVPIHSDFSFTSRLCTCILKKWSSSSVSIGLACYYYRCRFPCTHTIQTIYVIIMLVYKTIIDPQVSSVSAQTAIPFSHWKCNSTDCNFSTSGLPIVSMSANSH